MNLTNASLAVLFSAGNLLALPFWALIICAPRWRMTQLIMRSPIAIIAPALLYLALVLPHLSRILPILLPPELSAVAVLLGSPEGAAIAWVHFLCFDLFVGRWAYLDSQERGISPFLMAPVLFLTLMVGPLGFLLYLTVRHLPRGLVDNGKGAIVAAWRENRPLTLFGVFMLITLVACLFGLATDPRVITGAPAWMKPTKFAISTALYAFTLLYLLRFVQGRPRLVTTISVLTALCLLIEIIIVAVQMLRGTTSHFNVATPLDTLLWNIMGVFIVPVWLMSILTTYLLIRQRGLRPAFAASLRWGALLAAVGMGIGFLMTSPKPAQMTALKAGRTMAQVGSIGGHTVGAVDGSGEPGLPVVGWSRSHGDLRVPHFVGLHALQLLPLFGMFLLWQQKQQKPNLPLSAAHGAALVHIAGTAYGGVIALLTWQALRGQSLLAPDTMTLAAAVLLTAATLLAGGTVLFYALRDSRHDDTINTILADTV